MDSWFVSAGSGTQAPVRVSAEQAAAMRTAPFRDRSPSYWVLSRLSPTEMHVKGGGVERTLARVPAP